MASEASKVVSRRQLTMHKNYLEREALREAYAVLDDHTMTNQQRVAGAARVLSGYAKPYGRLLRLQEGDS